MRIAFATCSALRDGWDEDHAAAGLLGAEFRTWDDPSVDWTAFDRVVIRSTWDYTARVEEFVAWCSAVGRERLRNTPGLVAFNADKRYLAHLPLPTVPTVFVAPHEQPPALEGEVVIKPNVSAGARDTGRFGQGAHDQARALIARIQASGRVALIQPYMAAVDELGETSCVFLAGALSHVLRKRAVLAPDEVAPIATGKHAPAAAMLRSDLVTVGTADGAQRAVAHEALAEISERFGTPLYARGTSSQIPTAGRSCWSSRRSSPTCTSPSHPARPTGWPMPSEGAEGASSQRAPLRCACSRCARAAASALAAA